MKRFRDFLNVIDWTSVYDTALSTAHQIFEFAIALGQAYFSLGLLGALVVIYCGWYQKDRPSDYFYDAAFLFLLWPKMTYRAVTGKPMYAPLKFDWRSK